TSINDAGKSALYISHNLGVVSRISDRVAVLYASEVVETGPTAELFQRPVHPYTQGLIRSIPQFGQRKTIQALQGIPGEMVKPGSRPQGCLFASRCELATEKCQLVRPEIEQVGGGQTVRCHYWQDIVSGRLRLSSPSRSMKNTAIKDRKELLSVNGLEIDYGFRGILGSEGKGRKRAVNHVGLVLSKGEILGIVGESGSGKTSLARAVIGLVERSGGDIRLHGLNLPTGLQGRRRDQLKSIQMIYQNPEDALNPHLTVGEILARPLIRLLDMNEKSASERVGELLLMVNLPPDFSARRPGELSGGEKQRVALARAFAANPDLVLADEPVSALDVSIRAGILDLISKIQAEKGTSVIFISHDLSVVAYLADQVAVMYLGQIVEFTGNEELLSTPHHPYTEALLSLAPGIGPGESQTGVRIEGEIPLGVDMLKGCPFYSRCPRVLGEVCRVESPPWRTTPDGKRILCHIPLEDPLQVQGFTMPSVTEDR
ncbi:MAG: ATP-binding cassette domain-containing protein, partial [Anaerolineae bacterium]|nr:ATP-binding cassette domain-containing protein [Anaerolineae bacterium]